MKSKVKNGNTKNITNPGKYVDSTVFFCVVTAGLIFAFFLLPFDSASAQSGVLIPLPSEKPNANILSLAVMNVEITIDNNRATVKIKQIFDNHTAGILEGKYIFALPNTASIADFAVWDNDVRIPGVMMEVNRANRIYGEIKQKQIDPGILQTTDETSSAKGFSAKIVPINSYGTKRLEMEYTEDLPVDFHHHARNSHVVIPNREVGNRSRIRQRENIFSL